MHVAVHGPNQPLCTNIFFPWHWDLRSLIQTGPGHLYQILKECGEAKKGRVREKAYDRQTFRATVHVQ